MSKMLNVVTLLVVAGLLIGTVPLQAQMPPPEGISIGNKQVISTPAIGIYHEVVTPLSSRLQQMYPMGISIVRPFDWDAVISGSHNQGDWVEFTHTLGPDSKSLQPTSVYNEDYTTMWGVGKYTLPAASYSKFGTGEDGDRIVTGTVDLNPIRAGASGTAGSNLLTISGVTGGGFHENQLVLIHQTRGSGVGQWELNWIQGVGTGSLTLKSPLANTYTTDPGGASRAQVLWVPQYRNVTIEAGANVSPSPWDGNTGGVVVFLSSETTIISGTVNANAVGYRGGTWVRTGCDLGPGNCHGYQGEGTSGEGRQVNPPNNNNGTGGGGGRTDQGAGGGGGNGTGGGEGWKQGDWGGYGGSTGGSPDLTTAVFGGGGGGGTSDSLPAAYGGDGGNGGGLVMIFAKKLVVSGTISANGENGDNGYAPGGTDQDDGLGGGGGAGGSILIKTQDVTLGTDLISAIGGSGGSGCNYGCGRYAGNGGVGRIRVEYCYALSGSTNPTASVQKMDCHIVEQVESVPYDSARLNLPESFVDGRVYKVQYGRHLVFNIGSVQTTTLRVPVGQYSGVTLDAMLIDAGSGDLTFRLDIGEDGTWDWVTTQNINGSATLSSPDLASAFNTYWISIGRPALGNMDVPAAIWITRGGRVLLTNLFMLRIDQIPPIASISSITPNPAVQGRDDIVFTGEGTPRGSATSITAYRWRSSRNGDISTQATFTMAASSLMTGTHTISLTVQDNLGNWSAADTRTLTINPAPSVTNTWTFILYLDGDNNLYYWLNRAKADLESLPPNANVKVVMLLDAYGNGNTWRYLIQPNGQYTDGVNRWYMNELNMGQPQTLSDFITWARTNYPSQHYYLAVANHGRGTEGIAWDDYNGHDRLTTVELKAALDTATSGGTNKLDIVHYDACLMGMLEDAYQIRGFADYLIASENLGWSLFGYDLYVSLVTGDITSAELAAGIVDAYYHGLPDYPLTISAVDLRRAGAVKDAASNLGSALRSYVLTYGNNARTLLLHLRNQDVQKFDSRGFYVIDANDEYVDLYDLALKVQAHITDTAVVSAAQAVINAISGATPFVVSEQRQSGWVTDPAGVDRYWNLDDAHGASIYFPPAAGGWDYSSYVNDELFDFTVDSQWNEFLATLLAALPPETPTNPGLPPMLPPTPPVPLPRDCGGVTPPGVTPPACCVYGYVYYDGTPALSATVTISSAHGALTRVTAVGLSSGHPYYGADLSSAPLGVMPGETITVTASYSGRNASLVHQQVIQAGQQVDIVLPSPWEWGAGVDGDLNVTGVEYTDNTRSALGADALAGQPGVQVVNASGFQPGQEVLIIQMQGVGAGNYETGIVAAVISNTIELQQPIQRSYYATFGSHAQVIRVPHYRRVNIGDGGLLTAHAWNQITGTGGIMFFRALTLTVQGGGSIDVSGKGFEGGVGNTDASQYGWAGASYWWPSTRQRQPNDGGGGGGGDRANGSGGGGGYLAGGAGSQAAANNESGTAGQDPGLGDLDTEFYLGSGGGGATVSGAGGGAGGRGSGSITIFVRDAVLTGTIMANGQDGLVNGDLGGGGGAGGAIRIVGGRLALGTNLISAQGGRGGQGTNGRKGGDGSSGRIRIEHYGQLSGSIISPTASIVSRFGLPIATIHYIVPGHATQNQDNITFCGRGTDSDEGGLAAVAYRWRSSISGIIGAQATFTMPAASLAIGTHVISLTVQDALGNWSPEVSRILIISGAPHISPTASILSITPNPAIRGQDNIVFVGSGTPHGNATNITTYQWTSSRDGQLSAQASFTMPASSLAVGAHIISFTVQDNLGAWSIPVTRTLTIQPSFQVYLPVILK